MTRDARCAAFVLALAVAGIGRAAFGVPLRQPAAGLCYATDGTNVETTYLSGGAFLYPGPSDVEIEPIGDGGVIVHHSTRFLPIGTRVYLPAVAN